MKVYLRVRPGKSSVDAAPYAFALGGKLGNAWEARDLDEKQLETLRASGLFEIRQDEGGRRLVTDARVSVIAPKRKVVTLVERVSREELDDEPPPGRKLVIVRGKARP